MIWITGVGCQLIWHRSIGSIQSSKHRLKFQMFNLFLPNRLHFYSQLNLHNCLHFIRIAFKFRWRYFSSWNYFMKNQQISWETTNHLVTVISIEIIQIFSFIRVEFKFFQINNTQIVRSIVNRMAIFFFKLFQNSWQFQSDMVSFFSHRWRTQKSFIRSECRAMVCFECWKHIGLAVIEIVRAEYSDIGPMQQVSLILSRDLI